MNVHEPKDGYEYLEALRRQNKRQTQSFNDFAVYLEAKARRQGVPIHGQFELTPLCNLNCGMCYVHLTAEQMKDRSLLSVNQWKALMRQAFERGMFQATLTGGECLTYPGFDDLYLYLHSLGCQVDILTNGTLLDEDRLRFFLDHPPALVQITLYGGSEDAYERVTGRRLFHTVRDNILRVRAAGLPLLVTITPSRLLGEDVYETIRAAREISENVFINTSLFVPEDEPWRMSAADDPDVEYYVSVLRYNQALQGLPCRECPESALPEPGGPHTGSTDRGLACGGGRSGFVITWKGEMRICNRLNPKGYPLRDGFDEAWRTIHEAAVNWPRAAECRDCAYEAVCNKCAAEALKYAKAGERPTALCVKTRYMASRGVLSLSDCDPMRE